MATELLSLQLIVEFVFLNSLKIRLGRTQISEI